MKKTKGGGDEEAVPRKSTLDPSMRLGVLRVMHSCLSSISDKLVLDSHSPSREFLVQYITPDVVARVFQSISTAETSDDVDALPILLKVLALINISQVSTEKDAVGVDAVQSFGISPQIVLDSFVQAWQGITDNEDIGDSVREAQHAQHAAAAVDVICTLGNKAFIMEAVTASFSRLDAAMQQATHEPHSTKKGGRGKKGSKASATIAVVLPLDAAVALLSAIIESPQPSIENVKLQLIRSMGEEVLQIYLFSSFFFFLDLSCYHYCLIFRGLMASFRHYSLLPARPQRE